jgi:Cys-tRNA(Pro)/Cys-tRNA(Cys) deacylase
VAAKKRGRTPGAATPALVALKRAGIAYAVHEYHHDPDTTAFGLEAAQVLGLDPDRVLKTLLAEADGQLVVAVVPVSGQLSLKALAAALGAKRAAMADAGVAERATGYVVGGISPVGQRKSLPTVVDAGALDHSTVFVSGGRRGMDIELTPEDLIRVTNARTAPVRG